MQCDTFLAYPINSMDKLQYGRAHRYPPARSDGAADRGARATRLPSFRAARERPVRALRIRRGAGDRGGGTECRRLPARRARRRPAHAQFGPGQTFDFAASDIHRVLHVGDEAAVTLHAYSPPLWRMGAYAVREDGVLARHSVSYAEELYPL